MIGYGGQPVGTSSPGGTQFPGQAPIASQVSNAPLINRPGGSSPRDDQRSYDVYHRAGTGNPLEAIRDINWSQVPGQVAGQLREAAQGYGDIFGGGAGQTARDFFSGNPRTDAFYQAPGYAERYLQPQMDDIAAGELSVGPGGGLIHQPAEGGRGRETTVADRQALILAGQDAYYDEHGNVRPAWDRAERGIVVQPDHFTEGSAAGGTSNIFTQDTLQGNYSDRVTEANDPAVLARQRQEQEAARQSRS